MPHFAFLWAMGLGAVAGLGQAPVSLPWLTLVAIAAVVWLHLMTDTVGRAARLGWAFGFGYFALTLNWIVEPFLVDPVRHGWMAPFALGLLAAGLALFWGAAAGLARRFADGQVQAALTWAIFIAIAELARSYVLTGFPWALVGHVWIGWAPAQWAAWIGAQGLTLVTLVLPALVAAVWPNRVAVGGIIAAGVAIYGIGVIQSGIAAFDPETRPYVRLIQPNAPQHLKWHPDHVLGFFERQVEQTAEPSTRPLDLIIWPETSVPIRLGQAENALGHVQFAANGVPVILGVQRFVEGQAFNSLAVMNADGAISDVYDKHHLVPFGEYIPGTALFENLPIVGTFVQDHGFGYTPGPGARVLDLGSLGTALPLICYEAIFAQDVNAANERPDWLMQITNDAWFGQWVGPYQHLAQARLRAIEQGLPMVRVANTGVSAVIDGKGHILAQTKLNEIATLDTTLPPALPKTLYARTGDWPATILFLIYTVGLTVARRRNRH